MKYLLQTEMYFCFYESSASLELQYNKFPQQIRTDINLISVRSVCLIVVITDYPACKLQNNRSKSSLHLKLFIGDAPWAAAATTRAVATILIIIFLRVVLGAREAPPGAGSSQRITFQIQVLLAYEQKHTEHLQASWLSGRVHVPSCFSSGSINTTNSFMEQTADVITHSLFLQVVSHLLVFVLRQLLVAIVIVLGKDGLNLCICVALSAPKKKSKHTQDMLIFTKPNRNTE